ncbi:hypothetical protein PG991_001057 [Apiospora marii]|uniref:Rhodopsin domain-containing protein n=1 Tax=Apiospora marii TaxID=335849 RepID=A0ABR1STP1_9PEZI
MSATDPSTIQSPLDFSDKGPAIIASGAALGFVSTIIVALRFWSRRLIHQRFGLSDYLCLAALLFHHGVLASGSVMVKQGGLGRDFRVTSTEDPNSVTILYQALFVGELTYTFSSPLIKLSVLAFFWKMFPTRTVKSGCTILGLACAAWWTAIFILNFTQCRPLEAFWHIELQALPTTKCIDPILAFFANSVVNCIIDFFTVTLPIQEVMKLQTTTRRKVNISIVFLLGGIAFAASLVRTIFVGFEWKQGVTNFTKQFIVPAIAFEVEIYAAIMGACLPMMVPVYRKLRFGDALKTTSGGSGSNKTPFSGTNTIVAANIQRRNVGPAGGSGGGSFERLGGSEDGLTPANYHGGHRNQVSSEPAGDSDHENYPLEAIKVRRDLIWREQHHNGGDDSHV